MLFVPAGGAPVEFIVKFSTPLSTFHPEASNDLAVINTF
jgi:hypothetical protein